MLVFQGSEPLSEWMSDVVSDWMKDKQFCRRASRLKRKLMFSSFWWMLSTLAAPDQSGDWLSLKMKLKLQNKNNCLL